MNLSTEVIFHFLKGYFTEEEIFKKAEFSRERFFINLENEKKGLITQAVIKQHFCLTSAIPLSDFQKFELFSSASK